MAHYYSLHFFSNRPEAEPAVQHIGDFVSRDEAAAVIEKLKWKPEYADNQQGFDLHECYTPKSDFVALAASGDLPLVGSDEADRNLRLLIAFTSDSDVSNRDWATMTLAMQDIDTLEVRAALRAAAEDSDVDVRAEALEGLAQRDKDLALPLVHRELAREECGYGAFKAALSLAHPSLLEGLRGWAGKSGTPWIDDEIKDAIAACEAAQARRA